MYAPTNAFYFITDTDVKIMFINDGRMIETKTSTHEETFSMIRNYFLPSYIPNILNVCKRSEKIK